LLRQILLLPLWSHPPRQLLLLPRLAQLRQLSPPATSRSSLALPVLPPDNRLLLQLAA
jgi:hypothetical protein